MIPCSEGCPASSEILSPSCFDCFLVQRVQEHFYHVVSTGPFTVHSLQEKCLVPNL